MSTQGSHAAINGNNFEKIIRKELRELFDLSGDENITEHQMLNHLNLIIYGINQEKVILMLVYIIKEK